MVQFKKHILILTATPNGIETTKTYLFSQGWDIKSTDIVKEALSYLAEHQPEVVLICMDHANRNVMNMPTAILERYRCCVIATTEKATMESYYILQKVQCDYRIFPPLSGPAIERNVSKYLKKCNELLNPIPRSEVKRSGISPKAVGMSISTDRPPTVIDYGNMTFKPNAPLTVRGNHEQDFAIGQPSKPMRAELPPANKILVQGTEKIITDIIEPLESQDKSTTTWSPVSTSTQITCMMINCPSFQGYLVAALGRDCHLDEVFTNIIHRHLIKFLEEQGEKVESSDVFHMQIKPVAFLEWAEEYANFLKKSIHKGNEIAFAFFPIEGVTATYAPSSSDDMLSVPVNELFGDMKVSFDIFIHFPNNNRYVLYTPSGSVFYAHQQERLVERGIKHIHIRKEHLKELNRYRAQKYFNTIVEEHHSSEPVSA